MSRSILIKEVENTRLLSNYGGWIYCDSCDKTIGYLCYANYDEVSFSYECNCGSKGILYIKMGDGHDSVSSGDKMDIVKNRLCCPKDASPLITIRDVNLKGHKCKISCHKCFNEYTTEK